MRHLLGARRARSYEGEGGDEDGWHRVDRRRRSLDPTGATGSAQHAPARLHQGGGWGGSHQRLGWGMPIVALENIARRPDHRPVRSVTFQWSAWVWWSRSGVSFRLRCPRSGAAKSADGKVFRRDQITKSRARAAIIMVPPPGLDRPPSLGDGPEPVDVQAFVAQRPGERLDVDAFPWFPRT